jgi:hypothetical protein
VHSPAHERLCFLAASPRAADVGLQVRLWEAQPSGVLSEMHDAALAHLAEGVRACSVGAVRKADRLLARLQADAASAAPEQLVRRRLLFRFGISKLCWNTICPRHVLRCPGQACMAHGGHTDGRSSSRRPVI